jgi:hypothetical protein
MFSPKKENEMSIDFHLLNNVPANELFDGRLEEYGVSEHTNPEETTETFRCLTDHCCNYLWVHVGDDGFVAGLTRYAPNGNPSNILEAIAEICDTQIVSEYEPQYWGFDTQEEWDAWSEKESREHRDQFHIEILKYLRGESNDIRPGTIGMIEAEIAKALAERNPALLLPANKDKLLNEIATLYNRGDYKIILSPQQLANIEAARAAEGVPF